MSRSISLNQSLSLSLSLSLYSPYLPGSQRQVHALEDLLSRRGDDGLEALDLEERRLRRRRRRGGDGRRATAALHPLSLRESRRGHPAAVLFCAIVVEAFREITNAQRENEQSK